MSENPPNGAGSEDDDLGQPVVELEQLRSELSPGFFETVRLRINRRVMTSQLFEQAWTAPLKVFLEFVGALLGLLSGDAGDPDRSETKESGS